MASKSENANAQGARHLTRRPRRSATIHQDAEIYRVRLKPGQTVTHELRPGRGAWLQIAEGSLALNGSTLTTGDGASSEQPGLWTLTATEPTEALLFDLELK